MLVDKNRRTFLLNLAKGENEAYIPREAYVQGWMRHMHAAPTFRVHKFGEMKSTDVTLQDGSLYHANAWGDGTFCYWLFSDMRRELADAVASAKTTYARRIAEIRLADIPASAPDGRVARWAYVHAGKIYTSVTGNAPVAALEPPPGLIDRILEVTAEEKVEGKDVTEQLANALASSGVCLTTLADDNFGFKIETGKAKLNASQIPALAFFFNAFRMLTHEEMSADEYLSSFATDVHLLAAIVKEDSVARMQMIHPMDVATSVGDVVTLLAQEAYGTDVIGAINALAEDYSTWRYTIDPSTATPSCGSFLLRVGAKVTGDNGVTTFKAGNLVATTRHSWLSHANVAEAAIRAFQQAAANAYAFMNQGDAKSLLTAWAGFPTYMESPHVA